ncbi:MAG: methyltransferase domain-containing protein [Oscillospiraceae bacterium]|nr:methyltransferase domain-containing protein [Oscillospiraceae bacterium]
METRKQEKQNLSLFICPICRRPLEYDAHSYRCRSGHCYDIAREGYVNLLPVNQRHSDMPGDDRAMVNARTGFLDGGWYEPLRERLCMLTKELAPEKAILLDAGCGEGYYTGALSRILSEKAGRAAGIDLSKSAVRRAAKRCPDAEIAVASVYHMPLTERSADILINCFSPLAAEEFTRVLKPGGFFLYVVPDRKHLWEMKEILYDAPYENSPSDGSYAGFRQIGAVPLEFRMRLQKQEDIMDLFQMTPYAWKTPKSGRDRLAEFRELTVTAQFRILVFQREGRNDSGQFSSQ